MEGFQIKETQLFDIKQVREPIQYDNSAHIKEIFGYVDEGIIEAYKKQLIKDPKTDEEKSENEEIKKRNEEIDTAIRNGDLSIFKQRIAKGARYYTFDGTQRSVNRENIATTQSSLSALAILESVKTEDSEHILKNLKELFNDLSFDMEDSTEEDQATMEEKNTSLKWIFKDYIPDYDWPTQAETPKATDKEGKQPIYLYKVSAGHTEAPEVEQDEPIPDVPEGNDEAGDIGEPDAEYVDVDVSKLDDVASDFEEGNIVTDYTDANMVAGFKGNDILISPAKCEVKAVDKGKNILTLEIKEAIKTVKQLKRKLNKDNKYELVEEETTEEDETVKNMTLTIYGIKIKDSITLGKELIAGEQIGVTIKGTDIGLLLRGQDLTAEATSSENLSKLSVPRYIYPPEKSVGYIPDYIVKTDIPSAAPYVKSAQDLKKILDTYVGKDKKRSSKMQQYPKSISDNGKYALNTEELANELFYLQETYKINAIYIASASIYANGGGRAMPLENNILNILRGKESADFSSLRAGMDFTGQLLQNQYFTESRYTVTAIRKKWNPGYENKSPSRSQQIISQMTSFFLAAKDMGIEEFKNFEPPEGVAMFNGGDVLEIAKNLIDYIWKNRLSYNQGRRNVIKNSNEYHAGKKLSQGGIDCSTFVSWVIYEYSNGQLGDIFSPAPRSGTIISIAKKYNGKYWTIVSRSNVQPGDILVKDGHTEIYAGKGMAYSCGGRTVNGRKYATGPGTKSCDLSQFTCIFRLL